MAAPAVVERWVVETWWFIGERFVPRPDLGVFATRDDAVRDLRAEQRRTGKDMGRFRVAPAGRAA